MPPAGRGRGGGGRGGSTGLSNGGMMVAMDDQDDMEKMMAAYHSRDNPVDFPGQPYPAYHPPIAAPPTKSELRAVQLQQQIMSSIRNSNYYVEIDDNIKADAKGRRKPAAATYNPFEDFVNYGNKSGGKPKKGLPLLAHMREEMRAGGFIDKSFFPQELHDTVAPAQLRAEQMEERDAAAKDSWARQRAQRKKEFDEMNEEDEDGTAADKTAMDEDGAEKKEDGDEEEEAEAEAEKETDFEDDEDDNDDYNAEQYFDDEKEEVGDGGGDDDGGAGDDY